MRMLNTSIKRPNTAAMAVECINFNLEGATVFSVLDMNEATISWSLTKTVDILRHINQAQIYKAQLYYGTISVQDIFDKTIRDTIEGLDGVLHIRDDFIVYGKDTKSHDQALERLLQRFKEYGLTFNRKKCKFYKHDNSDLCLPKTASNPPPAKFVHGKPWTHQGRP